MCGHNLTAETRVSKYIRKTPHYTTRFSHLCLMAEVCVRQPRAWSLCPKSEPKSTGRPEPRKPGASCRCRSTNLVAWCPSPTCPPLSSLSTLSRQSPPPAACAAHASPRQMPVLRHSALGCSHLPMNGRWRQMHEPPHSPLRVTAASRHHKRQSDSGLSVAPREQK